LPGVVVQLHSVCIAFTIETRDFYIDFYMGYIRKLLVWAAKLINAQHLKEKGEAVALGG